MLSIFFAITPLSNIHDFLIHAHSLSVYALWLSALHYAIPYLFHYFLWQHNLFIYALFLFTLTFSGTQSGRRTRAGCVLKHVSLLYETQSMNITVLRLQKDLPHFTKKRKFSIVRLRPGDVTPSSAAETSDTEAITAVLNDHVAYIFKKQSDPSWTDQS